MANDDNETINSQTDIEDSEEQLDPRIQLELEKLNAATDGINHLETEFGEAQALFQQMMQDATFQLKTMRSQLGKSVEKSRPYHDALKLAKYKRNQLHQAALKFEQAQSRHYNAKKHFEEAEKMAFSSKSRRIDPALQEILNQATIEVSEASSESKEAWEEHREASVEFEEKQKNVQELYNSLKKNIIKSGLYFELKKGLNGQLEIQKQRLEKIQAGIQGSKNAYSETLHTLEDISDEIHKARQLKRQISLEPRGEGVGADSDNDDSHNVTMEIIRNSTLDLCEDTFSKNLDTESTDSEVSTDTLLACQNSSAAYSSTINSLKKTPASSSNNSPCCARSSSTLDREFSSSAGKKSKKIPKLTLDINGDFKEISNKVDSSYEVITSHSIPCSPPPFDILDGRKDDLLTVLQTGRRARSFTDVSHFDYLYEDNSDCLKRCHSDGATSKRRFGSFSFGYRRRSKSPDELVKSVQETIARFASLQTQDDIDA